MPKSESQIIEEPFLLLGYGVNAFFEIMNQLAWKCVAITVFLIPIYYIYAFDGQNGTYWYETVKPKYFFHQFSLGNLGGATTECMIKKMSFVGAS